MNKRIIWGLLLGCMAVFFSSCRVYKQDIMLATGLPKTDALHLEMAKAEKNYRIQPNDLLEMAVYTNKGERIIDPDFELMKDLQVGGGAMMQTRTKPQYLVQHNGVARLPMVGDIYLQGYTLYQADSMLARAYNEYYKESFVLTRFVNKRVVVLGSTGGQVIPLLNENTNLLEILALAGGISGTGAGAGARMGKAHNIRLIRGDLQDPEVHLIDLSTIAGMRKASMVMQPDDIVYVEPVRRMLPETIRDITPVVSLLMSAVTLWVVASQLSNN